MTSYIVLVKPEVAAPAGNQSGARPLQGYVEHDRVEASSSDAAVRNAIKDGSPSGLYVAIPLRSWQPLEVKIETKAVPVAIGKPADG